MAEKKGRTFHFHCSPKALEERKMAAHAESCRAIGVSFVPLVMETLGGLSQQAVDTLSSTGRFVGFGIQFLIMFVSSSFCCLFSLFYSSCIILYLCPEYFLLVLLSFLLFPFLPCCAGYFCIVNT